MIDNRDPHPDYLSASQATSVEAFDYISEALKKESVPAVSSPESIPAIKL